MKHLLLIPTLAFLFFASSAEAQSKQDKKNNKLLQKTWDVTSIEKGGRPIDVKKIMGEVFMDFYTHKKKDRKTGKKVSSDKFWMEMAGSDRIFDYKIEQDSVKFVGVNGWNDFKIVTLEKEKLELKQLMDGDLIKWILEPAEEQRKHK